MGRKVNDWLGIRRLLIYGGVAAGGVFILTDNLSTAVIVMAITCVLIFVAHPKTKPFLMIAAIGAGILIVIVAILAFMRRTVIISESEESQHGWIRKGTRMAPASRCFRDCMRSDPGDSSEKVLETARRSLV